MEVTREVSTNLKGVMLDFCKLPDWRSSAFHHFESSEIETKVTIQGAKQEKTLDFVPVILPILSIYIAKIYVHCVSRCTYKDPKQLIHYIKSYVQQKRITLHVSHLYY